MKETKKPVDKAAVIAVILGLLLLATCIASFHFEGLMYIAGLICGAFGIGLFVFAIAHRKAFHQDNDPK